MKFAPIATLAITALTSIIGIAVSKPALAKPIDGVFSIQSRNGNFVDVYGDNFRSPGDNTRVSTHLWNAKTQSNNFELGPDEMSGNELRVAGQGICLTPNAPLGSRPADGTPVVATRDCNNSWNWKRVGQTWVIGRHMDLCLDIVWGKDKVWSGMQVVTCRAGNPAQQFGTGRQQAVVQPQAVVTAPVITKSNNQQPTSIIKYNTVSQSNYALHGTNTNGGGPSTADQAITCFVFGKLIPIDYIPGISCNQFLTNLKAGSIMQFPNIVPMSWETASKTCDIAGGKLVWNSGIKMCFKK